MTNGYLTFLDYLELRRRVERQLRSGNLLLLHLISFGVGAAFLGFRGFPNIYPSGVYYFVDPTMGHIVGLWSAVLLVHGLWIYRRSGARAVVREEVIEHQMRERVQADNLYLSNQPKDLFRLHGLLDRDIEKRASLVPPMMFFIIINAFIWIPWALADAHSSFPWTNAPLLIMPLLLTLIWNFWQHKQHNTQLRDQLEQLFSRPEFETNDDEAREMRLSENDEMMTVDEYMTKRKRSSS